MVDRPVRPQAEESFLLDELPEFTYDQSRAIDILLSYMDDLELWVEDNITAQAVHQLKNQVADLQTQLKDARDSAAQARSQREEQLQQTVQNLSQELSFMQIKLGGIQLILR